MPYVAIKTFPKNGEEKAEAAERISKILQEVWGCEPDWISVSIENIDPDDWDAKVVNTAMRQNMENMLILDGKKIQDREFGIM